MELDSRILDDKKPLTAFDEMDSKFIGTDCYFSDKAGDFGDLSNCQIGSLLRKDEATGVFSATKNNSYAVFNYCLPCEWVKEEEKTYRPYSLSEWIEQHEIGDIIHYRCKSGGIELCHMYLGTRHKLESRNGFALITLGDLSYSLERLFEDYEIEVNGEWVPFGVKANG